MTTACRRPSGSALQECGRINSQQSTTDGCPGPVTAIPRSARSPDPFSGQVRQTEQQIKAACTQDACCASPYSRLTQFHAKYEPFDDIHNRERLPKTPATALKFCNCERHVRPFNVVSRWQPLEAQARSRVQSAESWLHAHINISGRSCTEMLNPASASC